MTAGQSAFCQKSKSHQEALFGVVTYYSQEDLREESWAGTGALVALVAEKAGSPWKARGCCCSPLIPPCNQTSQCFHPRQDMGHFLYPYRTAEAYRSKLPEQWDCVSNLEVTQNPDKEGICD